MKMAKYNHICIIIDKECGKWCSRSAVLKIGQLLKDIDGENEYILYTGGLSVHKGERDWDVKEY